MGFFFFFFGGVVSGNSGSGLRASTFFGLGPWGSQARRLGRRSVFGSLGFWVEAFMILPAKLQTARFRGLGFEGFRVCGV